jgi:predicted O-methyltransferase YrrM
MPGGKKGGRKRRRFRPPFSLRDVVFNLTADGRPFSLRAERRFPPAAAAADDLDVGAFLFYPFPEKWTAGRGHMLQTDNVIQWLRRYVRMDMERAARYVDALYERDELLERVEERIRALGMPDISVPKGTGRLLTLLAGLSGAKRALEIGTLGGYSAICIARGLPEDGHLTTLELNPDFARAARDHFRMAGLEAKVTVRVGDARASLAELAEEGERFGFVFMDADKFNYPHYLEAALRIAEPGCLIVADNILTRGRVFDPARDTPSTAALREFNRSVARDPRLQSVLLPAYDGLAILRVKA